MSLRSVWSLALLGFACAPLIGIEEVHEGPEDGVGGESGTGGASGGRSGAGGTRGGTAGTPGTGGSSAQGGSAATGGTGQGGSTGGSSGNPATGGASSGTGGSGAEGGEPGSGGSSGMGGSAGSGSADMTVNGRVVNHWLRPIEGVRVMIGNSYADTDEDGEFTIPDVPETYDAKFVISYFFNYLGEATYGWVYEGLTRRDPTLQVYGGLDFRSSSIEIRPSVTDLDDPKMLVTALGSPFGASQHEVSNPAGVDTSTSWSGPTSTTGTAHSLLWTINEDELPATYLGYDSEQVALADSQTPTITPELVDTSAPDFGSISGTVTSTTSTERENRLFLRFSTNADIELAWHYGSSLDPNAFSYVIPSITNATVTVSATEGTAYYGAAGVAHQDGITLGTDDIELAIPDPPRQQTPADGITDVDGETVFTWSSDAATFVYHADNVVLDSPVGGLYIVTAKKQVSIPTFPNGFELIAGDEYSWRIETHGDAATVDELAGEEGFADSFAASSGEGPTGPRRDSGTWAISAYRYFVTAP